MDKAFKPIAVKVDTEQELNALMQVLDWATRQGGIQAATPVAIFVQKIEAARIEAARDEDKQLSLVA